jgi:hypothetical protein
MMEIIDEPEKKKPEPKKESLGMTILSMVVSVFFIIRGSMYMGTNMQTWGIVLLLVGMAGLVFKIYLLAKNK